MAEEVTINLEEKKWYAKQRSWALLLGFAALVCSVIPGAQVAVPILTGAAALLGGKGVSDAMDRTENIVKAEAKATLLAPPC